MGTFEDAKRVSKDDITALLRRALIDLCEWEKWVKELEGVDMSDAGHIIGPDEGLINDIDRLLKGLKNGNN